MIVDEEDYLEHYGKKGMKWGVRRHRSTFPNTNKTPEKTLRKRVKKADRINKLVNKAQTRTAVRPIFVRPKYNVPSLVTPTIRSLATIVPGTFTYSSAGFVRRINKEYGGHSYQDILKGEGVVVTNRGRTVTQDILSVQGGAKLPPETVKAFKQKEQAQKVKERKKAKK